MRPTKKERAADPRALVTDVNGAAARLQKSKTKIYALLHAGELESYLDGRSRRVTTSSIEKYIERKVKNSPTFERERYPTRAPPERLGT
jgi:excisionase family DNA binding protein